MARPSKVVLLSPRTVINDQELQRRSQCSLYHPAEIDRLEEPSRLTVRWALRERHSGKVCSLPDLRAHWVAGWIKGWGNEKISRSEEHTSELQSLRHLVCRLLL